MIGVDADPDTDTKVYAVGTNIVYRGNFLQYLLCLVFAVIDGVDSSIQNHKLITPVQAETCSCTTASTGGFDCSSRDAFFAITCINMRWRPARLIC